MKEKIKKFEKFIELNSNSIEKESVKKIKSNFDISNFDMSRLEIGLDLTSNLSDKIDLI